MKKDKVQYGFGPHLMIDCYGCNKEKLSDMDLIFDTLDKFPDTIKMTKIMPPYVFKYQGVVPEDYGISGVVLIAESHITIHTFPEKQHAFIDIFSCKDFDTAPATAFMIDLFEAANYDVQLSSRGMEFPRNIQKAAEIVSKERRDVKQVQPRVYH
ncbi:MAG: adenosylmethionine decarboxylase [Candidatus Saganbacteria bacterium]|nr:adenosylmethionine decarboxylase [Candidatus Saganbacteria bacterium]